MSKVFWFHLSAILFVGLAYCSTTEPHTVIVTCASGELGSAIARSLAPDHHLILTGRNKLKLQQLQDELRKNHPCHYEIESLDYSDKESIDSFKARLGETKTPIMGLVLITPRPGFYGKGILQEESVWLEVIQKTFTGPLEALKGALAYLSSGGKIVAIAGTTSVQFLPDAGPSCVIRRMWTTYMKGLVRHLAPQNISVNTLSPGVVLTEFHRERIQKQALEKGKTYEEQMASDVASIPLQRHAKPEEVAQTTRFLLSKESDFINGANVVLDGGFTVSY